MSPYRNMHRKPPPAPSWLIVAVLVFVVLAVVMGRRAEKRCEARGGVYLWREGKCVRGIER